ncbi:hypothetical protein [Micromonospora sp. LOL_024]|uniref:hypothetical protein n=1 Tax=Micromonospora sp. LOL_024 TaxID=3345412 RepID=UPI003A8A9BB0
MTHIDDTAVLPRLQGEPADEPATQDDDGLAAEIAKAAPRRWWNRGTIALGTAALLLAGFLGGLQTQQRWGTSATTATARPGGAQDPRAAGNLGSSGRGQGPGTDAAPGPASTAPVAGPTTGEVKLVDGTTIYVETPDGTVVTVRTTDGTAVRTATAGKLADVEAGDTVSVQGATGEEGTMNATTVTKER